MSFIATKSLKVLTGIYILVHYTLGNLQLIRCTVRGLAKRQIRPGGVINLTTGQVVPLGLKGPHTYRKIRGITGYAIVLGL
jgi:hypothetical protein